MNSKAILAIFSIFAIASLFVYLPWYRYLFMQLAYAQRSLALHVSLLERTLKNVVQPFLRVTLSLTHKLVLDTRSEVIACKLKFVSEGCKVIVKN